MQKAEKDLIKVEELCEWLMIGKTTAYNLLKSGEIKCFRMNRIWKIPRNNVTAYINEKIKTKTSQSV